MLKTLITSVLYEAILFLRSNPDFFTYDVKQRQEVLKKSKLPSDFYEYFLSVKEESFIHDMASLLGGKKSILSSAFALYFSRVFSEIFDKLTNEFSISTHASKLTQLKDLVEDKNKIDESLRSILLSYSYQDIAAAIIGFCSSVGDMPYIVVQSPREIESELKVSIRERLKKEYPLSFPIFQINPKLIGGIRIFKDGTTFDDSWLSRIHRFISLPTV